MKDYSKEFRKGIKESKTFDLESAKSELDILFGTVSLFI